ncbi:metallophosphatase [Pseudoalteromonas luteoviolacea]|uniref:metallophosphatase n=1 Tax=Pseudoalteromonas luteoviolacea TaxID=43657 RepID=UPI001B36686B|nr:metallophosphatase [Pseudoalteromonas luteoviolacea]MBQ4812843.1 metallophosphatase [Pseudoalteromonas luteoviolacea]
MALPQVNLPTILSGPMVRRAEPEHICLQFVVTKPTTLTASVAALSVESKQTTIRLGERLYLVFLNVTPSQGEFPSDEILPYKVSIDGLELETNHLSYGATPSLVVPKNLSSVLHGSCRNPHHPSKDSLVAADEHLYQLTKANKQRASLLLMSGDQVYADDVAGPMLNAIYQLIPLLGIYKEQPLDLQLPDSLESQLYVRDKYLPKESWEKRSKFTLGYWTRKDEPHFSSVKAGNHLISFEEFIAFYILNFSSAAWSLVKPFEFDKGYLSKPHALQFETEERALRDFIATLPSVERLMANISTLMMFDDHDITDDWNLTPKWEQNIANSKESKRIVTNGLIAYWLFQGLGNDALTQSAALLSEFNHSFQGCEWDFSRFDKAINRFGQWHYCLDTYPKVVVLDTRTHRWRSEQDFNEPSGLMDWESLMELQDVLINHESVLLVSPAPVFGVKAIETIQAIFNSCGEPLVVDVENWMAHEGAAKKLIAIFKREDTPKETIILSGDVHYSFCFSVQARFGRHHNRIWQLTASGIKNEFPKGLLNILEKLDTWLFATWSPFNLFTKRWQLAVSKHKSDYGKGRYLVSDSAISLVELEKGKLKRYALLHGTGEVSDFDLN